LPTREPKLFNQLLGQVEVGNLKVRPDVVNLADFALVQNRVDGVGDIRGENVAPRVGAVAVQADLLAALEKRDKLGNDLLRVLVGSVDVVAAGDDDGQVERLGVGVDQHLGGGLGSRIRVGGLEDGLLEQVAVSLAVDLVGRNVNHAVDTVQAGSLEQDVGADDIVLGELERVTERVVWNEREAGCQSYARNSFTKSIQIHLPTDVALSGEMDDGVDVPFCQHVEDQVDRRDITLQSELKAAKPPASYISFHEAFEAADSGCGRDCSREDSLSLTLTK